jgi:hypothetical protein
MSSCINVHQKDIGYEIARSDEIPIALLLRHAAAISESYYVSQYHRPTGYPPDDP